MPSRGPGRWKYETMHAAAYQHAFFSALDPDLVFFTPL
ncbi:hypothetical protein C7S15_5039 [Burkholderia cepacia]|nr:hypothetical protein [Burkholderia cepacia]